MRPGARALAHALPAFRCGTVPPSPPFLRAYSPLGHELKLCGGAVTTPFALAGAEALGADPTLTAAILSVGAIHCALLGVKLLDALGMRADSNPLARGLAMGCSSYGVGCDMLLSRPAMLFYPQVALVGLTSVWSCFAQDGDVAAAG